MNCACIDISLFYGIYRNPVCLLSQCLVEVEDYVKLRQKCSLRSTAVPTEREVAKLISVWEVRVRGRGRVETKTKTKKKGGTGQS